MISGTRISHLFKTPLQLIALEATVVTSAASPITPCLVGAHFLAAKYASSDGGVCCGCGGGIHPVYIKLRKNILANSKHAIYRRREGLRPSLLCEEDYGGPRIPRTACRQGVGQVSRQTHGAPQYTELSTNASRSTSCLPNLRKSCPGASTILPHLPHLPQK